MKQPEYQEKNLQTMWAEEAKHSIFHTEKSNKMQQCINIY